METFLVLMIATMIASPLLKTKRGTIFHYWIGYHPVLVCKFIPEKWMESEGDWIEHVIVVLSYISIIVHYLAIGWVVSYFF